ncbi:MAG: hypothetical protein U0324_24375 [Polyangiales bacterium]
MLAKPTAIAQTRRAAGVTSDGPSLLLLPNGDGGENFEAGFSLVERESDDVGEEVDVGQEREPGVYRLLQQAAKFRRLLETGAVETRADLARRMGVSRARVTQVMGVWRLHRPVVEHLRAMAAHGTPCDVSEHEVRALAGRSEVEQDRWAQKRLARYREG